MNISSSSERHLMSSGEFMCPESLDQLRDHSIKWQPVVLCVSFPKDNKAGSDPLGTLCNRLVDTDIKVATNYIIGTTTHVVQSKRNTAKGLHALINAKYIVTESFIDALIYATVPTDMDHDESLSPLEEDFDKNWPEAMQHVPPRGREPNERPVEAFAPNPERADVFEGYTVVFCEKSQFDSLQPPITNGGGKAFLFKLKPRQTTTEELVGYVKNVAGEKGLGELEDGSEGKGVVVVKFRGGKDDFDWAAELGKEASLALDLRFIEQNEFMDAILMNDASVLRRPLEAAEDNDDPDNTNRAAAQNGRMAVTKEAVTEEPRPPPPPPRRQRGLVKSRFKGFSDDEDDDDVKPSLSSIPVEGSQRQSGPSQYQTQTTPVEDMLSQPPNPRKRPAPEADDGEDFVDQLLPAAAAMKRRRVEEARQRGESPSATSNNREPTPPTEQAAKKATSELDIKKSLRERRAAADQAAARESEDLHQGLDTADVEAMRNLAVVEEFEVLPRANGSTYSQQQNGERWNPLWNGRKNFKKFRRQGQVDTANARRGGQGVIVPLEELRRKDFGIGEEYWLESNSSLKRKRDRASQVVEGESQIESVDTGSRAKAGRTGKEKVPKELVVEVETDGDEEMGDVVDVEAPRRTRGMDSAAASQTQASRSSVRGKSGIGRGGSKGAATRRKQGRLFEAKDDDGSESEEDELKFRFGKRRRLQQ
ncbi:MAG: hypothetical protein Q9218_006771 [Villophora microphyllina]